MRDLVDGVLYGFDADVAAWVAARVPGGYRLTGEERALGIVSGQDLVGGVIYSEWNGPNVIGSIALEGDGRHLLSRRVLRRIFDYPFNVLGCQAFTVMVAASNLASLNLVTKMGFEGEAIVKFSAYDGSHLIVLKMFRDKCRWIDHVEEPRRGIELQSAGVDGNAAGLARHDH